MIITDVCADYAAVIVLAVFIFAAASWMLSARKWFVGPLPNVDGIHMKANSEKEQ